jgi:peptidyl-prolyl cis-trans isomerase C
MKVRQMFASMHKTGFVIMLLFLFSIWSIRISENGHAAVKRESYSAASPEDIIALVDDARIDITYLASYLSTRPLPVHSGITPDSVEQRLEELVTSEVLCKEAVRIGLDRRPEIRLQIQQILAQSLLEEKVNRPVREREITEQELRAYYNENKDEFQRPAQVRLADIFISVAPATSSDERTQKKAKAEEILSEVLASQDKRMGFGQLMLKYSDTPEKYPRGNTGFFDIEGKPIGLDPNLARQAFKLNNTSQICERIIKAADGYHIIMLTGRRDALSRPFERVKEQLRLRMYRERIEQAQAEYIESLKKKARIDINRGVLGEFVKEQQAKAGTVDVRSKGGVPTLPMDVNAPPRKTRGPQ